MPRYHYVVLTSAVPGQIDEFENWYDNQHVPDMVRIPGVKSVRRFRLLNAFTDKLEPCPYDSLAIYEFDDVDDPAELARQFKAMSGSPEMPVTDAIGPIRTKYIADLLTEAEAD